MSVFHKVLNAEGVRAAVYWPLQSPHIKTLRSPATEEFKNQRITQRNDFSRRLNSPYALEQELSSSVGKGATSSRRGCSMRDLHMGQWGGRDSFSGARRGETDVTAIPSRLRCEVVARVMNWDPENLCWSPSSYQMCSLYYSEPQFPHL